MMCTILPMHLHRCGLILHRLTALKKTAEIFKNNNLNEIAAQLGLDGTNLDADTLADYVYKKTSKRTLNSVSDCQDCVREAIIFGEIKIGGAKKANEYIALSDSLVDGTLKINSQSEVYKLFLGSSEKIKTAFFRRYDGIL